MTTTATLDRLDPLGSDPVYLDDWPQNHGFAKATKARIQAAIKAGELNCNRANRDGFLLTGRDLAAWLQAKGHASDPDDPDDDDDDEDPDDDDTAATPARRSSPPPGNSGGRHAPVSGDSGGKPTMSATKKFGLLVEAAIEDQPSSFSPAVRRQRAVAQVRQDNPKLCQRMIDEANAERDARVAARRGAR